MNLINRLIIILALIVALVIVTAACLFPDFFIQQLVIFADRMERVEPRIMLQDRLILIAIAAVVDLVLILFLLLQFRRSAPKSVRIQRVEDGTALLSADSIQKRLAFYIDGLPEVVNVQPKVRIKKDTVAVAVDVQTSADVDVPSKAREIVSVIRMVVTETMGLALHGEPQVNIRTASFKQVSAAKTAQEVRAAAEIAPAEEPMAAPKPEFIPEAGPAEEAVASALAPVPEADPVEEAIAAEEPSAVQEAEPAGEAGPIEEIGLPAEEAPEER